MKVEYRVILTAIGFGLLVWIVEAWLDAIIFYDDTFLNSLILNVSPHELFVRLIILGSFIVFGVILGTTFARRLRAEQALREREHWFATTLRSIGDAVISTDLQGNISFMNPVAEELTGWQQQDALEQPLTEVFQIVSEITGETQANPVAKVLEKGTIVGLANHTGLIARDGTQRSIADSGAPIKDDEGDMQGVVLVFRDVTEKQQAEIALRRSEEKFRTVVQNSQAVIFMTDSDGVFTLSEGASLATLGLQPGQVVGLSAFELYKDYPTITNALRRTLAGEHMSEATLWVNGPDGNRIHFDTSLAPYKDAKGNVIGAIGVAMDTTQRQQTEDRLQQYANRLGNLRTIDKAILTADSLEEMVLATLSNLRKLVAGNRASVTLYNFDSEKAEILAVSVNNPTQLQQGGIVPLKKHLLIEHIQQGETYVVEDIAALEKPSKTDLILLKEGVRAYISAPLLMQEQLLGALNVGYADKETLTADHQEIMREVADQLIIAIRQVRLHEQVQHHASNLEVRVMERTEELETANQALQKLSDIKDDFVANVSHELRTPITSIKLYLYMLKQSPENQAQYLATLERETGRLENIVEALLYVSRLDQDRLEFNLQALDLNELLASYIADRAAIAKSLEIELVMEPAEDLPLISADRDQMGQVISVLLTNAVNYTPLGGRVTVQKQVVEEPNQLWVVFSVSDNGPGVAQAEQEKLFTRFYRGHAGIQSGAPGTGLGLSIAKDIVEQHGGRIEVKSEGVPGKGTTFSVWLPAG